MKIKINHPDGRSKIVSANQHVNRIANGEFLTVELHTEDGRFYRTSEGVFRHAQFSDYTAEIMPPQFD